MSVGVARRVKRSYSLLNNFFSLSKTLTFVLLAFSISSCDFNPLGGSKSKLDEEYEPGKREESQSPTISAISDVIMDQDDQQVINFTIGDTDTFMMCSSIYVRAISSDTTLIDYQDMVIGGTYPYCTLRLTPKAGRFGTSTITVEVYDFWTTARETFALNVLQVFTPGLFSIVDAEGADKSVLLTWSTSANMTGSSARYSIFYRESGVGNYIEIRPAISPYLVNGLINGNDYDFFVRAKNSVGQRDTAVIQATPTRFRIQGGEFIGGSTQNESSPGSARPTPVRTLASTGAKSEDVRVTTTPRGYKVFLNGQGNIISGAGP